MTDSGSAPERITVSFKTGIRPDGEIEVVTITQGATELRLTAAQAESLRQELSRRSYRLDELPIVTRESLRPKP